MVVWFILCWGWNSNSVAAIGLSLVDGTEVYPVGLHLFYFDDKEGGTTLEGILSGASRADFVRSEVAVPNFGFTDSSYWFQLDVSNRGSRIQDWLLESQYPLLDHIDVHLVYPDNRLVSYRGGDKLPFGQRAVKHRNVFFNIPLALGESVRVYIKVRTESSMQLPLVLRSPDSLLAKDHEEQYFLGLFYGVLLAMLLYNLLIFASIRDKAYFYSVWYIGGWILFQMSLNGLAFEYIWPSEPAWGNKATPFFIGVSLVGMAQFTRSLLQTSETLPKFDRVLKFMVLWGTLIMLCALFASYTIAIKLGTVGALALAVAVVSAGSYALRFGIRQARYFMLAWTALLLGIMLYVLKTFGVLPATMLTDYSMQIGSAFEVVLLSFALADRMRMLKDENERIQHEATETLERRVLERTLELDEALLGLSEANNKLVELNHVDGLTGISNRGCFNKQFSTEWQRAARIRSPLGLLMLDIDHFKRFNDTHGHLAGDACLKLVASVIDNTIRRPADKCYRYGGEEFVVLLPYTNQAGSLFIAERICKAVAGLEFVFEGKLIPVTISVGVCSLVPHHDLKCESLISNADQALYQAKHQGRNQVCGNTGISEFDGTGLPSPSP
jgi:diguanylate cyclase (GGDEF)-like protein